MGKKRVKLISQKIGFLYTIEEECLRVQQNRGRYIIYTNLHIYQIILSKGYIDQRAFAKIFKNHPVYIFIHKSDKGL